MRDVDGGFGDAVHVDQLRGPITVPIEPTAQSTQLQRFSAEDDVAQCVLGSTRCRAVGLVELVESRRGLVDHGHAFANQQLAQRFRRPRREVVDHDDGATRGEWAPQFPHGEVERVRVEQSPDVGGTEIEVPLGVRQQADDVAVRDDDALGGAGRTRGVDDVRSFCGRHRGKDVRCEPGLVRWGVHVDPGQFRR